MLDGAAVGVGSGVLSLNKPSMEFWGRDSGVAKMSSGAGADVFGVSVLNSGNAESKSKPSSSN